MPIPRIPADWPFRSNIRRIASAPHDWCVVDVGSGPVILLLHGAGGSSHSFRHLIPLLTPHYRVIVPDLPGQGFTRAGSRGRLGLDAMATDLAQLCASQRIALEFILGHSAGGAIAIRMAELLPVAPKGVIGINAALGAFEGAAGFLFPLMARVLAMMPLVPSVVSKLWGTSAKVDALLTSTGSVIEPAGRRQYLTLVQDPAHIDGTLAMMAQWRLDGLLARLPNLTVPAFLIATERDKAVPPRISVRAAERMTGADIAIVPNLGHLAHEEAASEMARLILPWCRTKSGTQTTNVVQ